ncbi:MAG: DJ-1/PfpI family protein, partial [Thermoleophilia bacterium]
MSLAGRRYAVLVAEGVEDLEFWVTVMRIQEEGATVIAVGSDTDVHRGKNGLKVQAEATADAVGAETLDGLVIPGGWAPDKMRR